ncbi:MAG: SDR family oxidoreductase [Bacillota bacterium]|nr:SDR family oxidoreductase [Bacillota bacterium]
MNNSLQNKIAVVTGASRGIGRAIAISYADNGAKVCCLSRSQSEVDDTAAYINKNNGNAIALTCDVSNYNDLERVFEKAHKVYSGIDIVVINAGVDFKNASVEDSYIENWKAIIDINLTGAYYTAKAAIPYLKKQGGGKIITIGSGLGHKGRADNAAYSCSKAGLWMLTRVLAQELHQFNISVNELIPGPVITAMGDNSMKDSNSAFSVNSEWVKKPEDVTNLAVFMAAQPLVGPTGQSFSLMRRDL